MNSNLSDRFWAKVEKTEECWEWKAGKSKPGYGRFGVNGKNRLAHRVSYMLTVGEIPEGKVLDHLCKNKGCVNPAHLEPVDFVENVRRGTAWNPEKVAIMQAAGVAEKKARTHCPAGHPYLGDNLYMYRGFRACMICRKAASARAYQRKKAQN